MLEEVDIKNLSDAQKDLIKYRRKLLNHLDKLLTYEIILKSSANYKKEFYEEFRRLSAVENAIRYKYTYLLCSSSQTSYLIVNIFLNADLPRTVIAELLKLCLLIMEKIYYHIG